MSDLLSGAFGAGTVSWVDALRTAGELSVSLVAAGDDGDAVGYAAFSLVRLWDTAGWYLLSPLAVSKEWRRRGIGSSLVIEGLQRLQYLGASGCLVVGLPEFYARFGFEPAPGLRGAEFQARPNWGPVPEGSVTFAVPGFQPLRSESSA